jgi:alkylation response protein AidB-like acyl-CoA dehydrogenase
MKVFDEQHEMFRAAVRSVIEKEIAPNIEAWEVAGRIPKSIWPRLGGLGFLGVEYDEKYGGAGADFLTRCVPHEEFGRSRSGSVAMPSACWWSSNTAEMVNRVAYECVQMHGGYGYMREYAVERFARDARLMTIGGGTSEIMREIIAKQLLSW